MDLCLRSLRSYKVSVFNPTQFARRANFNICRVLLGKGQAKVNVPDKEGFYPLHRCCQEAPPSSSQKNDQESEEDTSEAKEAKNMEDDVNRSEIAKLLVAKGVDVNVKEPQGLQTPLHLSAINGYASLVR